MNYFKSEDFEHNLERLNTLFWIYRPWKETKARKAHKDEFGKQIKRGEIYYRRVIGSGFRDLKLSEQSMKHFIHLLFRDNDGLKRSTDKIIEKHQKDVKDEFDRAYKSKD